MTRPLALLMTLLLSSTATVATASSYPDRPIRLVVAFPPGGAVDITARVIQPKFTTAMGQPLIIDYRGGGGGIIGNDSVAKAAPDGQTLLACTTSMAIAVALGRKLPYDIRTDFSPATTLASLASLVVVPTSLPAKSIKELLALAKEKPGQLSYASTGVGTPGHLSSELIKNMASVDIVHVPYKAQQGAVLDLVAGRVQLAVLSAPGTVDQVNAGKLRALAVTTLKRSALLPDVPTVSEAGLTGYEAEGWHGLCAPAGTPKPILERLYREITIIMRAPEVRTTLAAGGAEPSSMAPDEFAAKIRNEIAKWQKVVISGNIKAEE